MNKSSLAEIEKAVLELEVFLEDYKKIDYTRYQLMKAELESIKEIVDEEKENE